MASGQTMSTFNAVLKEHYTSDRVIDMTYRTNPLYAMMPKYSRFGGKNLPIPIQYGNPQGRSKDFSVAQARSTATSSAFDAFVLERKKDYSIATIENEVMEASIGNPNAFLEAATTEIDGAINSLVRDLSINMYRPSTAQYAQVLAAPASGSSTVITVKEPGDISNFEVGMVLVIYAAARGTDTARVSATAGTGGTSGWEIIAIDRDQASPKITLAGATDGGNTIAADDYIFCKGDRNNTATVADDKGIAGLESWIPYDPSDLTGSFFGVDRTVDETRLGGNRLDGTNAPLEEVLTDGDATVAQNGGFAIDHYFMSHNTFASLKNSLGSKVQYVDVGVTPRVSFRTVQIDGVRGPIKCVPDHNCPENRVFGLQLEYFKLYSLGDPVQTISPDGLQMLRQNAADGAEVRIGSYSQLGCRAPGSAITIKV